MKKLIIYIGLLIISIVGIFILDDKGSISNPKIQVVYTNGESNTLEISDEAANIYLKDGCLYSVAYTTAIRCGVRSFEIK